MAYNQSQDAPHTPGDVGKLGLGIRRDADTTPVDTDGDYHALLFDNAGNLKINAKAGTQTDGLTDTELRASSVPVVEDNSAAILLDTAIISEWDNTASDGASVSGDTAHDAVDVGEPVKIGGKGVTTEPSAVGDDDRVDAYFDVKGYIHNKNHAEEDGSTALTALDDTYDGTPSSNVGADVISAGFRSGSFSFTLETTAGTPTDITFTLQEKIGSNYHDVLTGPWGALIFEDTAFTSAKNVCVPIAPRDFPKSGIVRITVVTTGTDGSNIFVVSNATLTLQT